MDPPQRGILPVGRLHASRTTLRHLRRGGWSATLNACFDATVLGCAARPETWINAPLADFYARMHAAGHGHSLEVWQEGELAGGVFGIALGGAFFGESMFSARTDGSKMALLWLSAQLGRCGFSLFDTQFLTPHLQSLGATEISRAAYRRRLAEALRRDVRLAGPLPDAQSLWQEMTQTS
jgi:leucyl/phenylalanyl-tRNA--protein transferase